MSRPKNAKETIALPKVIVRDEVPTHEPPLGTGFHAAFPSHLIGRYVEGNIWPAHSDTEQAVCHFNEGQKALYKHKNPVAAIKEYEAAVGIDASYLRAWVQLVIAYITDNTPQHLAKAEELLKRMVELEDSGWIPTDVAKGMIRQNLAYLYLIFYRDWAKDSEEKKRWISLANQHYEKALEYSEHHDRLELLFPVAFVKLELGDKERAKNLYQRALRYVELHNAYEALEDFRATYPSLQTLEA